MNPMQSKVAEFNRAINASRADVPEFHDAHLRARLIIEEALEAVGAMLGYRAAMELVHAERIKAYEKWPIEPNLTEAVDGLCDLLYVTFGAADAMRLDVEPMFNAVHASNMAKAGAPKDASGKQLKPEGWVPPTEEIRACIEAQRVRSVKFIWDVSYTGPCMAASMGDECPCGAHGQ